MSKPTELVQGTLDLLLLKIVALEPMHGWAIAQRLKQMSNDVLQVGPGFLYPALHKLEQQGWIRYLDNERNPTQGKVLFAHCRRKKSSCTRIESMGAAFPGYFRDRPKCSVMSDVLRTLVSAKLRLRSLLF